MATCGGPDTHPHTRPSRHGEAGGAGGGGVLGLCAGGKKGPRMDYSHREQAHEAAVQRPCLLWGPQGPSAVLGSRVPGMHVHTRRHPQALAVIVEVMKKPRVPGQHVWPVAPSNMWQPDQAAAMCRGLLGQVTALPRTPAAQSSSNRPASLPLLHGGPRAWCWIIAALEPHSSALRLYNRGEAAELTVHRADLEAPHLSALCSDRRTAMYLQGTVVGSAAVRFRRQYGGDAIRLARAQNMAPRLRAFSTSCWKIRGDRERLANAWRRWVQGRCPTEGMLHLPQPPSVSPVRPAAPAVAMAKAVPKAAPKPNPLEGPPPTVWQLHVMLRHFGGELATKQRGSGEVNLFPPSKLEGAGHCTWRAGKHLRPSRLHPKDLVDHLANDHGSDPAQRARAEASMKGVMPRGLAGPFTVAKARSKALALPAGV